MAHDDHETMKLKNQLCFPLYAAARNVTNLYTPYLKPLGLTYTQYIAFLVLWERDGIPVRTRSERDDRVVVITLTEAGKALQEQAMDVPKKVASCLALSPEKAQALYALLYELLNNQCRKEKEQNNENGL